jgi:surfactin synthase thioesterase subunit
MPGQRVDSNLWIRRLQPVPDSQVRLVCFPFAGGAAGYFHWLQALLGSDIEVLGVQYPGRQDRRREPVIEDIRILADQVYEALSLWVAQPLAFFGHSMGAVVAFEVARRFALHGQRPPLALFPSGRRAPSRHRVEQLHLADDAGIAAELRSVGGTDPLLLTDDELLQMILPAVRGDYRAIETYRGPISQVVLDVPITTLIGDRDPKVSIEEANAWREHTTGKFALHVLPGGHFYLQDNASEVAGYIKAVLADHVR